MTGRTGSDYQVISGDSSWHSEFIWFVVIILLGVFPRLTFIILFPTQPISDFKGLVDFAIALHDSVFAGREWYWEFLNAGLPTMLSVIMRIFPESPETTARWATAVLTGFVPLFPYAIWRGVLSLRARILAGLLLALWPGQIFFSGVVAQDNWVILPTIALSALAVRSLVARDGGHPFWSAFLFALGIYIRQEMLVVLLPVALASAGLRTGNRHLKRQLLLWMTTALLFLLLIMGQRATATGRFSLTTEHGGKTMLGAYVPGAGLDYWTDPSPYIASIDSYLLEDNKKFHQESFRLALNEFLRRPQFHVVRMVSAVLNCLRHTDTSNFYWSLSGPSVLPLKYQQRGDLLMKRTSSFLNSYILIVHAVFLASFFSGVLRRNWPILVIAVTILLKICIHAVIVAQPRYFMPVIALEYLAIALSIDYVIRSKKIVQSVLAIVGATVVIFLLAVMSSKAQAYILTHDEKIQRVYRFSLTEPMGRGSLICVVDRGRLGELTKHSALIEFLHTDPSPGETANAKCQLIGSGKPVPLYLQIMDPYAPGGLPDRIVQRVFVDGQELFHHDLAGLPGSGWFDIPLGLVGKGTDKTVLIEIIAVRPDPGCAWGSASRTTFQLAIKETP
jgi:hypothetical protein